MNTPFVSFDELQGHIQAALQAVELPGDAPPIYLIRNLFGTVGIAVSDEFEDDDRLREALDRLSGALRERLGAHGRPAERTQLWVWPDLLDTLGSAAQEIAPGIVLAERLTAGRRWWSLDEQERNGRTIRYALYSVHGGVGRSTTMAVLAWDLARRGENVLAVDLDLESPGFASALLEEQARPDFGVADWFVEELVGQGDRVLPELVGSPAWRRELPGNVWIAPAHGRAPGEYLAKLGRVYMDTRADPWTARLRRLLDRLEARLEPTVVLLKSRSGFHDNAAVAVTDLGAEILLFGLDSPATWTGYRVLVEHWKALGLAAGIRDRLSLVSAMTPSADSERYLARFRENVVDVFGSCFRRTAAGSADSRGDPASSSGMERIPSDPLVIYRNRELATGSPLRRISESVVMPAYASFLRAFERRHEEISESATQSAEGDARDGAHDGAHDGR